MFYRICFCLAIALACPGIRLSAQILWPSPEVERMYQQARGLLSGGNLQQAQAAYEQLIPLAPDVMEIYRDLGRIYFLTGNYEQANKTLNSVINSTAADRQTYQVAAASLAAQGSSKKSRAVLLKGIERFPDAGLLYHELGRQYADQNQNEDALKAWLDGIEADPAYYINYYEAARMYMATDQVIWTILYAEIFLTREYLTPRAGETRKLLIDAYKKLYRTRQRTSAPVFGGETGLHSAGSFENAVQQTFRKLAPVVSDGFSTENLVMLRTRFLIEWEREYADKFPFSLFAWQRRMLGEGHFDAYNQWLLGKAENMQQYEAWVSFHKEAVPGFESWMEQFPYRPSAKDFYNDKKLKDLFSGRKSNAKR